MANLKNQDEEYELEFAVDERSDLKAIETLSKIIGDKINNEVSISKISKYGDLYFIKHQFSKEELTDEVYNKLEKNSRIFIVSDQLSLKRSHELAKICMPVEVFLKRLLIYVYPNILEILEGRQDKKQKIKVCNQISRLYLKYVIKSLEIDMTANVRLELLSNNGEQIADALYHASDFNDFKNKLMEYIRPNTVWEQINSILEKPIEYVEIRDGLHTLLYLRDKSAHPQTIFEKDLVAAKRCSDSVIRKVGTVKSDYNKSLRESIRKLSETLNKITKTITDDIAASVNEVVKSSVPDFSKIIDATISPLQTNINTPLPVYDWSKISQAIRASNPEMDEILERFTQNPIPDVINEMHDELTSLSNKKADSANKKS